MRPRRLGLAAAILCLGAAPSALGFDPVVSRVIPPGAERGSEIELRFEGERLGDAEEILWYGPGFETVEWTERTDKAAVARVRVAPDCAVGEHFLRLRTRTGLSYAHTFWVGRLPVVDEVEPNDDPTAAQPIPLDVTVHGVIENEDVDHFAIEALAGQRISVEVEALRLGRTLFDPYLAILDERGFELAEADDTALLLQDAFCQAVAPADGRYVVRIRDSAYTGSRDAVYRLHVGSFPRPTAVYPTGGKPGETIAVTFLGDALGPFEQSVALPRSPGYPFGLFAEQDGRIAPSWNVFRATNLKEGLDAEPNDDREHATELAQGTRAISGVLDRPGDQDWFRLSAKKGERLRVRTMAAFLGSAVDPMLWVYGPDGKQVGFRDDNNGPDGFVDFTAVDDADYFLRVADHLWRGGAENVYRVEVLPIRPSLSLTIPRFGRDSQARQVVCVPRGGRTASALLFNRREFGGDLELWAEGLPQGVRMVGSTVPADLNVRVAVFEADRDAPHAGALSDLFARPAAGEPKNLRGRFYQGVELVLGPPNRTVYYRRNLNKLALAVIDALPFSIEVDPPQRPLARDGRASFTVRAVRAEGFDEPIVARLLFRPPGLGAPSTVTIQKGQTEARYPIDANGRARIGRVELAVLGEARVNGGAAFAASDLFALEIEEPLLTGTIAMAALERGSTGEVLLGLKADRPLPGPATARLLNLPPHVAAEPVPLSGEEKELAFAVSAGEKAPQGKHKNLLVEVEVDDGGVKRIQRLGFGGVLRIDPKRAPKPAITAAGEAEPKPVSAASAAKEAEPKRLTRLEKLRLEAEARRQQATAGGPKEDR